MVDVFDHPVIQRCQLHKIRNVADRLPERLRGPVGTRMRGTYHAGSALDAEAQLTALARELDKTHPDAAAALARPGRYKTVADNLQVKEVKIAEDERFVVCFNPEAAERDAALRAVMVGKLEELIAGSDKLSERKRSELAGQLSTMPALRRYLRTTPAGLLRVDKAAVAAEGRLDGKYLLRCSDPNLSAEDIAWATSSCSKSNAAGET